jgi:hypothetical protein
MPKPWKTIRVVVEVPVLVPDGGRFTEKDLARSVSRAMESDGFWQDRKYLPKEMQPTFGRVLVKEFGRVVTAAIRFKRQTEEKVK